MLRSLQKSALARVMVLGGELFGEWYRSHFFAHLCTLDWSYYHEIIIRCKECKGVDICSLKNREIGIRAVCCWQDIDSVLFWMLCILSFCFRHTFFQLLGVCSLHVTPMASFFAAYILGCSVYDCFCIWNRLMNRIIDADFYLVKYNRVLQYLFQSEGEMVENLWSCLSVIKRKETEVGDGRVVLNRNMQYSLSCSDRQWCIDMSEK